MASFCVQARNSNNTWGGGGLVNHSLPHPAPGSPCAIRMSCFGRILGLSTVLSSIPTVSESGRKRSGRMAPGNCGTLVLF